MLPPLVKPADFEMRSRGGWRRPVLSLLCTTLFWSRALAPLAMQGLFIFSFLQPLLLKVGMLLVPLRPGAASAALAGLKEGTAAHSRS